ncbi:MAG: CPXCG motif-containing cysteine-rich protein [Pseudomonadales bacterium]|nr:CPXCG motif-containing cysteine-rich protein [Pseudomonadales bacterium]
MHIEDCQICCRPINFDVTVGQDGEPAVRVSNEDE